jgi:hypothetical protein
MTDTNSGSPAPKDLPGLTSQAGAYLEVDEARFDRNEIRRLYDSADYPLARRAPVRQQQGPGRV